MKKHVEPKMISIDEITYIAEDGESFKEKDACLNYEHGLKRKAIEKIIKFTVLPEGPMGVDYEQTWYLANDESAYNSIMEYYATFKRFSHEGKTCEFPCWICFKENCDGVAIFQGTLEDYLEKHDNLLNTFKSNKICLSCGNNNHSREDEYCSKCGKALESVLK